VKTIVTFIRGMWDYYVMGTFVYFFPPKNEGDESSEG
jgi:hypothetical protein